MASRFPLVSAVQGKITLEVPYGLAGTQSAVLQVFYRGAVVASEALKVAPASPGLLSRPRHPGAGLGGPPRWGVSIPLPIARRQVRTSACT